MNHYNVIREAVCKAFPQRTPDFHINEAKAIYDRVKKEPDSQAKANAVQKELQILKELATKKKAESLMYFVKASELKANSSEPRRVAPLPAAPQTSALSVQANPDSQKEVPPQKIRHTARAQAEAEEALKVATKRVAELATFRSNDDDDLKQAIKVRENAEKCLKSKQSNAMRQQKFQHARRQSLLELCDKDEMKRKKLCLNPSAGRPSKNETQPGLLEAITQLSLRGAGAHERRRADALNACRTLDDLAKELKIQGFNLSRSGVYLRLIPRNWSTTEGKRHITTVNVKLKRALNDEHKQHADTQFAKATFDYLMDLSSILGPYDVACLSQDDKAKVPLGLPAANKQSTIVMNMEYQVKLPDHDFVISAGHKLTPSVIAGLKIEPNKLSSAVTSSGPTYIAIRSGKHDSSVAATHCSDLRHLYEEIEPFRSILYRDNGTTKPVLVILVDGGPDENPRYKETIKFACANFIHLQLDALYIATQAPGRSAFNPVERRMAPLSRFLAGIILPHDTFGSHLNSQAKTIDEELEKKNFKMAGETLAEVWNEAVIDSFPVIAEWRGGMKQDDVPNQNQEWLSKHMRASQYFLQVVKCGDEECCAPMRSSLKAVIPQGFLPAPLTVTNNHGLSPRIEDGSQCKFLPLFQRLSLELGPEWRHSSSTAYDSCCPTVMNAIAGRTCTLCKLYLPSQAMVALHKKEIHPRAKMNEVPKIRPVRVAARRQRELMAIIAAGTVLDKINHGYCCTFWK